MADAGVGEGVAAEGAKSAGEAAAVDTGAAGAAMAADAAPAEEAAVAGSAGGGAAAGATAGKTGASLTEIGAIEGGTAVATSLLAPKPPGASKPIPMPDPLAQEQAKREAIIQEMARRGRAATILTSPGGGSLGG